MDHKCVLKLNELVTRYDTQGSGHFGAGRGNRRHKGRDFIAVAGQPFPSIVTGKVIRIATPYKNDKTYSGVVVKAGPISIKMFYVRPTVKPGDSIRRGDPIGIAQDISKRYPAKKPDGAMTPHIHVEARFKKALFDPKHLL